jgi:hypothetical protein
MKHQYAYLKMQGLRRKGIWIMKAFSIISYGDDCSILLNTEEDVRTFDQNLNYTTEND